MKVTTVVVACLALASSVAAVEDPKTTQAKNKLSAFCNSLNGAQGSKGENCFNIFGRYTGVILAAAAKNDPCGRTREAQALLDNFGDRPGAVALANEMAHAPINVIPPNPNPPTDVPCGTPLRLPGGQQGPSATAPKPAPSTSPSPAANNNNGNNQNNGNSGNQNNSNGNNNNGNNNNSNLAPGFRAVPGTLAVPGVPDIGIPVSGIQAVDDARAKEHIDRSILLKAAMEFGQRATDPNAVQDLVAKINQVQASKKARTALEAQNGLPSAQVV
ncbi:uncharacterized protein SPPG_05668 [Spizellomyces punctatus DAOM BR117]|uniref:Uncharacterized protein n=1 Tax=Spizellomyces punctatus (strain DAOM BR117) TaxID=645134 RepID=A0A0L0HE93_SPIPD|nr:uncharacterized protein SPPG_05668 [Spizellomyces punctatus DAOM BR117]KNC99427.1 hypothetical protein SPPG_05668 [Spizellomyces punctatus DAOM BR117]|eukprot:XP_016607467.1 hypothetical protein SPPG_05668 [Spizellomyces punctatus DAOM BR117]